ncbi:MAG: sigma-70 family RNA polymerase sigma factor [Acidimicrobiales bacterium]|nr:sigma-70 family RNA polymerase sigma factor [Acidimicrobiales bacterium]MDG2216861.1 sigma-70 family RNA polymerase sigma factor [Acidimicrobiales bacterium]
MRGRLIAPDPAAERQLAEEARHDPDAFADLYRLYVDRVFSFIHRRCGSKELAEDLTAVTFERALAGINGFKWRRGGIAPWLFRIASNQLTDHYRRTARRGGDRGQRAIDRLHDRVAVDEIDHLDAEYDAARLRVALDNLNPRYQRALSVRYLAELNQAEAAAAMGLAKPAFAVLLHRATVALQRELENKSDMGER